MPRHLRLLSLALLLAFAPGRMRGVENWPQLKLGMTAEETLAALGQPMLRTTGRGFETWIYDNGAEVLLFGSLIGWTAPASATGITRSTDVWRDKRDGDYFPTFLSRLPQPAVKRGVPYRNNGSGSGDDRGYWVPLYRTRR